RFFGKQVDLAVPHWSLYVLRSFRFLRHAMPWWHREGRQLLAWYEGLVDNFAFNEDTGYRQYVEALQTPATVTGYAEIRRPKMEAARNKAEQIRASIGKAATR